MTSLHHDRRVDDGQVAAPAAPAEIPAPVRGTSRRPAGEVAGTVTPQVPSQRRGKAPRKGTAPSGDATSGQRPARRGSAATAARTAAAGAAVVGTAAARVAARAAATARAAAARAAAPEEEPAPTATAEAAVAVEAPAAGPVTSARPTPFPRQRAAEDAAPADGDTDEPVAEPAFVDEALEGLQPEPAAVTPELATAVRRRGRHRVPTVRRRPALYLAAGLVGAVSLGAVVDTDPSARADATAVAGTVSVAEQLGLSGEPAAAPDDAESTRLLQDLVASRNERDAATAAAADAQAAADVQAVVAAAEAFQAAAEAARPKVVAPINGARLTSGFGARWGTVHTGIDLAAPMRTPEYSVMDGVVLEAGPASGYGLAVYIQHDNGDVTVYGHMDEILVQPGQVVRAGDIIALLGNRGQSTGPHLHFEVHLGGLDGTKVDPIPWLRERGVNL
ncbi:M23 family metallopeptidase [Blastococcus sp. SYSU D01042]